MAYKNNLLIFLISFLSSLVLLPECYCQIHESEILPEGIVFPRLNTAQRNALSAIQGQCIYNTQTKVIECYDGGSWQGAATGSPDSITDGDGDTNVSVESSPDVDEIQFTTGGTEVMRHDGKTLHLLNNGQSVFVGENAGAADNKSTNQNTFIGYRAGEDNVFGTQNVAIGNQALRDNQTGGSNIAIGKEAMAKNLSSSNNIAIGHNAGRDISNLTTKNTLIGGFAGFSHKEGGDNTILGYEAGKSLELGNKNTFLGVQAGMNSNSATVFSSSLFSNSQNVFVGYNAGKSFTDGRSNVFIQGRDMGISEGFDNVLIGEVFVFGEANGNVMIGSGEDMRVPAYHNTILGSGAAKFWGQNVAGPTRYNTFIGRNSGPSQNGSFGIVLGAYTEFFTPGGGLNNVVIGNNASAKYYDVNYSHTLIIESDTSYVRNTASDPLIYGEFDNDLLEINGTLTVRDLPIASSTSDLRVDSNGKLVLSSSDVRLKKQIEPIDNALEKLTQLQGVSFVWRDDPKAGKQLGLIAQEVQKVVPELINEHDDLLGLDYSETIGLLIEAIKEQQVMIKELRHEISVMKDH